MEIVAAFVADKETSVAVQPGKGPFDDPAVSAKPGLGLDAVAGDAWGDVALSERDASRASGIRSVRVDLDGTSAASASGLLDRGDGVDRIEQDGPLVDVGRSLERDQRDALPVGHQVVLGTRFATVDRVRAHRPGGGPPFLSPLAGTVELSMLARLQSILPASPSRSSST